jgi:hypothetical protein
MPTLHIHFDESGDWKFGPKGTRYFILSAAWTYEPRPLAQDLSDLRYSLTKAGHDICAFHASPNHGSIRKQAVDAMASHRNWWWGSVVMEKCKINPTLREPHEFYPKFAGSLLRFILKGRLRSDTDRLLIYTDTLPLNTHAKREAAMGAMKKTCVAVRPGIEYHIYSHRSESNKWLQVADYCSWSVCRKWESGKDDWYRMLAPRLRSKEMCITDFGDGTRYY